MGKRTVFSWRACHRTGGSQVSSLSYRISSALVDFTDSFTVQRTDPEAVLIMIWLCAMKRFLVSSGIIGFGSGEKLQHLYWNIHRFCEFRFMFPGNPAAQWRGEDGTKTHGFNDQHTSQVDQASGLLNSIDGDSPLTFMIPSGNQTWHWEIPWKWRFAAGKIIELNWELSS